MLQLVTKKQNVHLYIAAYMNTFSLEILVCLIKFSLIKNDQAFLDWMLCNYVFIHSSEHWTDSAWLEVVNKHVFKKTQLFSYFINPTQSAKLQYSVLYKLSQMGFESRQLFLNYNATNFVTSCRACLVLASHLEFNWEWLLNLNSASEFKMQ